jgi:hypothetical protein
MTNSLTALRSLNKEKPPSIEEIKAKTEQFMLECDIDGNQRITLDEFCQYVKTDRDILKELFKYGIAKEEDRKKNFGSDE